MKKLILVFVLFSCFAIISLLIGVALLWPRGEKFSLLNERGSVLYKKENGEYLQANEKITKLPNKTFVKTEDGYAHVILPDNSMISLDKNTEIQVVFEKDSTEIKQILGQSWHRIKSLVKEKEYSVTTSNTIATVRGTKFNINSNDSESTMVNSIENSVDVAQYVQGTDKNNLKYKEISDGAIAFVPRKTAGEINIVAAYIDIESDPWYKRNLIIDKYYDSGDIDSILNKILNDETLKEKNTNENTQDKPKEDSSKVILSFFNYINEGAYDKAVGLFSSEMVGTEPPQLNSQMQAWGVSLSQWKEAKIVSMEKSDESSWTETNQKYQVVFDLTFKENTNKGLWEEGQNTRWFNLIKENDSWKISSIATSL